MTDSLPTYPQNDILVKGVDFDVDEIQVITVDATGGTFTISFDGETTAAIAENATASAVQSALILLSNINAGDVTVTGDAGGPYTLTFGGQYADTNVPAVTTGVGSLTGGASTATVTTPTAGEGATDGVSIPVNTNADARTLDTPRDDATPEATFPG